MHPISWTLKNWWYESLLLLPLSRDGFHGCTVSDRWVSSFSDISILTCPAKTDPTNEFGLGSTGCRCNGATALFPRTDHFEATLSGGAAQPRSDGQTGPAGADGIITTGLPVNRTTTFNPALFNQVSWWWRDTHRAHHYADGQAFLMGARPQDIWDRNMLMLRIPLPLRGLYTQIWQILTRLFLCKVFRLIKFFMLCTSSTFPK
jgi:hypothetical protein